VIFRSSPIFPEVIIIELEVFEDQRGWFTEMYRSDKFETAGIRGDFVQDNLSRSRRGTVRGLHYQVKKPQGKLVWALSGKIYDVVVDIRSNSLTFKKWFGITLSDENKTGLYIPPNFAHGYAALSEKVDFFYKCTDFYAPGLERCIRWNDPELGIEWPIENPIVSNKDAKAPLLKNAQLPS
jgi:dTDP-4-dehydrorhamnose 3,5-epimerase